MIIIISKNSPKIKNDIKISTKKIQKDLKINQLKKTNKITKYDDIQRVWQAINVKAEQQDKYKKMYQK